VLANVVWIGALLAVAALVGRAPFVAEPAEVGVLARRVYWQFAVPGFIASFVAGVARIALMPQAYAHLYWMHAKLGLALVVIVLHHVIGARARRVARGQAEAGSGAGFLSFVVFLCVAGAVFLGVTKTFP
jgi:putative membrane protein